MASWALGRRAARPPLIEQRREPRIRVAIRRATVRGPGQVSEPAVLHDVSGYGCRLSTDIDLSTGERVWLRLDGSVAMPATVMWAMDAMIGCRFDTALDRHLLRSLTLGLYTVVQDTDAISDAPAN
jgi:hypothetical protein